MALSFCSTSAALSDTTLRNCSHPHIPRGLLFSSSPPSYNFYRSSYSHGSAVAVRQSYQGDSPAQPKIVSRENFEPPGQSRESVLFTFNDQLEARKVEGGGGDIKAGGGDGSGGNGGDGKPGNGGGGEGESEDKNEKMSSSQILTLAYAALVGVGGAIGYVKKKSMKSLISGAVSSLLLCYVCTQLPVNPLYASSLGLGVSGVLVAVSGVRLKKTGKIFPAGVLSLVSFIMAGGYLHGIMRASHA